MTEPMTPPECDLRGLPFMPLDTVRLMDSDLFALSTGEEFKAALTLWCKAWQQVPAASLPDDDRVLAHLSATGSRWLKVKALALKGFVKCSDGRLYHPVVAEKARDAWAHRLKQREKANRRWQERGTPAADATASPAAHPTEDAVAHPPAMQGTVTVKGEEERKSSEPNGSAPISDQDRLWRDGIPYLEKRGVPHDRAGSMIGKWLKSNPAAVVLGAISRAQAEQVVDPISFVTACLKPGKTGSATQGGFIPLGPGGG